MFSLSGAMKFKYIPNYKDMRGGYDKLRGVVYTLDGSMEEGTAYVFTSRNQKLVKIIRHENNECQLYMQKYDHGMGFIRLEFDGTKPIYVLEWKYLTALLSCPVIKKIDSTEVKYGKDAGNGIFRC
jgi:hypothetical protein